LNCSISRSFQELTVILTFQSTTLSLSAKISSFSASIFTIVSAHALIVAVLFQVIQSVIAAQNQYLAQVADTSKSLSSSNLITLAAHQVISALI